MRFISPILHASRKYTSETKIISEESTRQVIRDHARRAWSQKPFDMIVSGHVHVVEDTQLQVGPEDQIQSQIKHEAARAAKAVRVVNLGAWFDRPRVFVLTSSFTGFRDLV